MGARIYIPDLVSISSFWSNPKVKRPVQGSQGPLLSPKIQVKVVRYILDKDKGPRDSGSLVWGKISQLEAVEKTMEGSHTGH